MGYRRLGFKGLVFRVERSKELGLWTFWVLRVWALGLKDVGLEVGCGSHLW